MGDNSRLYYDRFFSRNVFMSNIEKELMELSGLNMKGETIE